MEQLTTARRFPTSLAYVSLVALLVLGACASQPAISTTPAEDPETVQKEIEVGKASLAKISGKYGIVRDQEATIYLNKYLKSLALYAERQGLVYSSLILANDQVNAYSLPGGYVLVTLGALKGIQGPGELAGILAHELGHINKKHILNHVKIEVRYSAFETLARVLAGSRQIITDSVNQINEKIEERLFLEGYAQAEEFEADAYALRLLQSLGMSAEPFLRYLTRLEGVDGQASMENLDKTHPPLAKRIEAMRALLRPGLAEPVVTKEFTGFIETIATVEVQK